MDSLKWRETPQLAFKNEKGGVRKFVKPMLSAAPGLRQTHKTLRCGHGEGINTDRHKVRYLPFQAGDLIEFIKVL